MKAANRRCSNCRKKCPADEAIVSHLRAFCSFDCLKSFTANNKPKIDKQIQSEKRKDLAIRKEKLKTRSDYIKEAQQAFNEYVRFRDAGLPCISCGRFHGGDMFGGNWDCGHYRSVGSAPHLRFHLWNAHKQCVKCNRYLSGNIADYRVQLVWKIGQLRVDEIETKQDGARITAEYAKRVKEIFRRKKRIKERIRKKTE